MKSIKKITIIGAGIMGAGIASSIFKYGLEVKLFDVNNEILEKAYSDIKSRARRNMNPDNIKMASSIEDAVKDADLIIEAIIEDLNLKCEVFEKLGKIAPQDTIFASNTSSLSISKMAEASGRPDRFIGLHFFNPAIIMRLVEIIIPKKGHAKDVYDTVKEFIDNIKKTGVKCVESPGFVVNRILIPLVNEAFHVLEEIIKGDESKIIKIANNIDSAFLKENILLMGPFDLVDLTGIDTVSKVAQIIYTGFNNSPRYIPCGLLKNYKDKGYFGRKAKRGIYYYENQANDPDLNPCLDEKGNKIIRMESPDFQTIDLVAPIVNEAFRVLEEGIVDDYNDIELCMELGTRWPKGPFKLAKEIGVDLICKTLEKIYIDSNNNPRYEQSKLLTKLPKSLQEYFAEE